jgi:MFS family permease
MTTEAKTKNPPFIKLAIPLLGILGGVQGVDPNIAATALPEASKALSMQGDLQALAASVSTLALAASVVSTGLLADRIGRRKVLLAALILSAIGDLIVVLAPQSTFYLAGRAIAGIGLGAVYGAAFAYIRAVSTPKTLPSAIGIFTAVLMAYTVLFTFIGGALSDIDWRLGFLVTPVIAVVCFFAIPFVLPSEPVVSTGKADAVGQIALIIAIAGTLYGIGNLSRGILDPFFYLPLLIGIVASAGFVWREKTYAQAFFPIELFRSPVFLAAILAGLVYNLGNAVAFLQMSNLWHYATRLNSLEVSLWQLPFLLSGVAAGLVFGKRMSKGLSNRTALLIGTILSAVGFVLLAVVSRADSFWVFLVPTGIIGFGIVVASLPFGNLIMQAAPARYFGPVTSARTTIGQVWYTVGLAISTVMVDRITSGGVIKRLEEAGVPSTQLGTALDKVTTYASQTHDETSKIGAEVLAGVRDSYLVGFNITMLVFAAVILLAGLLGVALLTKTSGDPRGGAGSASDPSAEPTESPTAPH